jgi:hypothetical protein
LLQTDLSPALSFLSPSAVGRRGSAIGEGATRGCEMRQEGQGEQAFPGFDFWLLPCSTALLALFGSFWLFLALYGFLLFMALANK